MEKEVTEMAEMTLEEEKEKLERALEAVRKAIVLLDNDSSRLESQGRLIVIEAELLNVIAGCEMEIKLTEEKRKRHI